MKKECITANETKKDILSTNLEFVELAEKFDELSDMDDLWYFIKSSSGAWIAGSAN